MKTITNTVSVAFKIRPGEGLPTFLLFLHSFFMGLSMVFMETSSMAMFLKKWNIAALPFVYIASSMITVVFGIIYSKMEESLSFSRLLITTISFMFATILLFYIGILTWANKWTVLALIVWYNVALVLTELEFGSLSSRLLNVRQGKRLFALTGAGGIIAGIMGGFSVSFIMKLTDVQHLILLSSAGMFACMGILIYTTKKLQRRIAEPEEDEEETKANGISELLRDRYCLLIFSVAALSLFAFYILDYVFYEQVEGRYVGEENLAGFLGIFIALTGIVNLIGNAFFHSRLMERYGIAIGLLAVPVVVAAGCAAAAAANIPNAVVAVFWILVITKGFDEVFRVSIEEPSFLNLYQPFPATQRLKVQTFVEAMVEPTAGALIGGILILLTSTFAFNSIQLIYVIAAILVIWIFLAVKLRREYTEAFTRALSKRRLSGKALSIGDRASIEILVKGLQSEIAGEVINCLNMLEEVDYEELEKLVIRLLDHPDPQVRRHALERIEALNLTSAASPISKCLETEQDTRVMGVALRTLCAVSDAEAFELVYSYLEDKNVDIEVKRGAMAGLLSNGGIDGVLSAGSKLNILLESENPDERKLAAQVLGEVGISSFYRPLLTLLEDENQEVRSAAITASGKLKNLRLLPQLLNNFTVPELSNFAVSAVVNFGEPVLPELEHAFDREDQFRQVRIKLVRIIGRIGGPTAVDILKKKIDFSEEDIRSHVLSALVGCKYQAGIGEIETIHDRIRDEVKDATWTLSVLVDIGDGEEVELLASALKSEVEKNRKRIFALLAMIYPTNSIMQAQLNLASTSKDRRANALEMLDNTVTQDIKTFVFPLLDDIPSSQRLSRLITHYPQQRMSRHERLKEILARSQQWTSSWTKTCSLFVVGKIATKEFFDSVVASLSDSDDVVRETAVWALGCLNPDDLVQRLTALKSDRSKRVGDFARFVINSVGFARIPMGKSGYLTRSGRYTADLFANILHDPEERRLRRCRAANILSRFQVPAARKALFDSLTVSDKTVRTSVLDALLKAKFIIDENEKEALMKLMNTEITNARRILESIITFLPQNHAERLIHALKQEINHNRRRLLSILALVCEDQVFIKSSLNTLFYWYVHQEKKQIPENITARFWHLLTVTQPDEEKRKLVFSLFQYRNPAQLKRVWEMPDTYTLENVERHLKQIAFGSSVFALSWSRICALDLIVQLELKSCLHRIIEQLTIKDDVVRATSAWALFQLAPSEYRQYADQLRNDPNYLVSQTARQLESGHADKPMLQG